MNDSPEQLAAIIARAKSGLDAIVSSVPAEHRSECVAALILRALKNPGSPKIDMFGAKLTALPDEIPGRNEIFILPYNRTGSGANVIVACTTPDGREHFVAARKFLDPRDPAKGLHPKAILLGGYMQPALPLTEIGPKALSRANDVAEELVLIGIAVEEAYRLAAAQAVKPQGRKFDPDMTYCAMREAHEEGGIPVEDLLRARAVLVGENSRHGYSNTKSLQTVALNYMLDLGEVEALPELKPGSDVGAAWWSCPSDVEFTDGIDQPFDSANSRYVIKTPDGSPIPFRDDHGEAADHAIRALRDNRLLREFKIGLSTLEAHLGAGAASHMGASGEAYFMQLKEMARVFQARLQGAAKPLRAAFSGLTSKVL